MDKYVATVGLLLAPVDGKYTCTRSSEKGMMIVLILTLTVSMCSLSCKKDSPPEPPGTKPGKRDYMWTVDTISYPGSFQTTMRDIWGSAPNNVYIVGHNDQPGPGTMFRYDGTRWRTTGFHAAEGGRIAGPVSLSAIYGTGPSDIYAVGQRFQTNPNPPPNFLDSSLIIHFDGSQWSEVQLPRRGRQLVGITATSSLTLWAGGTYGSLYRYAGSSWRFYQTDTLFWFSEFDADQNDHFALAYTPSPLIQSPSRYFLLRWIEPVWEIVDSFSVSPGYVARFGNVDLSNIGGALYSAGDGVFKKNSSSWLKVLDSWPYPIYGLDGTRAEQVFAVGESASIYHFNGVDWNKYQQFFRDGVYCSAVWCTEEEVFVVGTDGNRTFVYHGK